LTSAPPRPAPPGWRAHFVLDEEDGAGYDTYPVAGRLIQADERGSGVRVIAAIAPADCCGEVEPVDASANFWKLGAPPESDPAKEEADDARLQQKRLERIQRG